RLRSAIAQRGLLAVGRACTSWLLAFAAGRLPGASRRAGRFAFAGGDYELLAHPYHYTWLNERAVEVPIVGRIVDAEPGRVLEVGNVLSHYRPTRHEIIDKYERAPGVRNVDVLDLDPAEPYDLIVSISTLEHVGWDEVPRDPRRALLAVQRLLALLTPGGELVVSVPVGYNPELDRAIRDGELPFEHVSALLREGRRWRQVGPEEAWHVPYDRLLYRAGAVLICFADRTPAATPTAQDV
ncbi:MAG: SAM-dependent methyltransferase, partial [Solirubrobacteraceae bacterium]